MSQNAEIIRENARNTVQVIDAMSTLLNKFASDNRELQLENMQLKNLNKQASAPSIEFNDKLMKRAAAAVCSSYGSNPSLTPEVLESVWRRDPNKMLDNLCKMASDLASAALGGNHIGVDVADIINASLKRHQTIPVLADSYANRRYSTHAGYY